MAVIRKMLDRGRTWTKLSGAYMLRRAARLCRGAADRARLHRSSAGARGVGSDWPHPTEAEKPDDAALLDRLADWAGDEVTRKRILVDNPAELYRF